MNTNTSPVFSKRVMIMITLLSVSVAFVAVTTARAKADSETEVMQSTEEMTVAPAVEKVRPSVVFSSPTTATVSGKFTAEINASDASGLDRMAINVHGADRKFVKACGSNRNLPSPATKTLTCTFDSTKLPNGNYELRGGAFDSANNNRTISEWITISN